MAKNYKVVNTEIYDSEDIIDDHKKKEGKEKLKDNIDIFIANLYSYAITIKCIHWYK